MTVQSFDTTVAAAPAAADLEPVLATPKKLVGALVRTARPRQWVKDALVLGAPFAAGTLLVPTTLGAAAAGTAAFTLAASSTYFLNDARDVEADRRHPVKRLRPVAAGVLSVRAALGAAVLCAVGGIALAAVVTPILGVVVLAYLLVTTAYSAGLKHVPVLESLLVAAGFVLRAAGGAAATGTTPSSWFLLVALFGSLYLVLGKRAAERSVAAAQGRSGRVVLSAYPAEWISQILTMALTGTVVSYALWALQYVGQDSSAPLLASSLVPFLAISMRYNLLVARGGGEQPEVEATTDRFLLGATALWLAVVGAGLYLA